MPWLWRWRPVHRDFYHDQVLVNGQRLAILDFDDGAMSEPAIDIANFAAHLHLLGAQQPDRGVKLEDARQDFVERCRDLDPEVDAKLLRFLEGATLLRLAEIHLPRQRGHIIAGDLLKRSLDLLQTAVD
jgi:Ser/Thr protein kinase RdoA (MazF antagonist)